MDCGERGNVKKILHRLAATLSCNATYPQLFYHDCKYHRDRCDWYSKGHLERCPWFKEVVEGAPSSLLAARGEQWCSGIRALKYVVLCTTEGREFMRPGAFVSLAAPGFSLLLGLCICFCRCLLQSARPFTMPLQPVNSRC